MAEAGRCCAFLIPGDLGTRTGGYLYDRHIVDGLRAQGWQVDVNRVGEAFPHPDDAAMAQARRVVEGLPDGAIVVVDGLALGAMDALAEAHASRLRWVALVHHPLHLETGLDDAARARLFASERRSLAVASRVIVTSPSTARALQALDVPPACISVIEPGTEAAPLATGSIGAMGWSPNTGLRLLCLATLTPRKGHAWLVEALVDLHDRQWSLHCAGSMSMDPACVFALRAQLARCGLEDRVHLHGELQGDALDALFASADVFVLPSFHEGYGMALAEALARGLPIVSTTAGAIPDTVPSDAGLLVSPGDVPALREALARMLDDATLRASCATGARAARARLPGWKDCSARFAAVLSAIA